MFFKNLQFLDKKWNFDTLCLSSLPSAYIHNTYRNSILVIHQSIFSKDESHTQVEKGTIFIIKSKGSKNNPRICKNEVGFEKFVFHTQQLFVLCALVLLSIKKKWKEEIVYFTFFQARKHVRLSLFPLGIHNGMFQNANLPFLEERRSSSKQNLFHMPFYTLKFIQKIDLMFE